MPAFVLFGVASAAFYGTTDFVSHYASRRSGVLRTMLYGQALLASLLSVAVLLAGVPGAPGRVWAVLMASDLTVLAATACLYRALAIGNLAVVPPVTACYGAVATALSMLAGERVTAPVVGGLLLAVAGGALAAVPRRGSAGGRAGGPSGGTLAGGAALLYGVGLWAQGRYAIPVLGGLVCVWSYYGLGAIVLLAAAGVTRAGIAPPGRTEAPALFGTALLALGGTGALAMGQATGHVAVVTALSSLASAVTVVLARVVLKQKVAAHGWAGLAAVIGGLVILDLG